MTRIPHGETQQIVGRERRERVSQLAWYGEGCFDSRRRVNSIVRRHYLFPMEEPLFIFIKIPESLEPLERAEKYEDALEESLASSGFGVLTGGGAMLSAPDADGHREIEYCGIDVDLFDVDNGLELLRSELRRLEAPQGTILEYTLDGISHQANIYEPGVYNLEH